MPSTIFPKGSEWRKWDLHVHTPYSILHNGFGSDDIKEYTKKLLKAASDHDVAVVGVTDYFSIEGYSRVRQILDDKDLLLSWGAEYIDYSNRLLFLPNIEFRAPILINDSRVNYHVIFSNEVSVDDINNNFLHELKFSYEGHVGGEDDLWPLTIENLSSLGKRLKDEHEKFKDDDDLFVGMKTACVDYDDISKALKKRIFKDKYLIGLPADEDLSNASWDGQGHHIRKLMIQKSHFIFSSNPGTRDFALGKKHPSTDDYLSEFKSLKPCIHGSDAHSYDKLFQPDLDRFTWVKADPTFQGLLQVLNEPDSRVVITDKLPASLARSLANKTKTITKVKIEKRPGSALADTWFNNPIDLNHGLIAIIGKKGSGKSALSDILGLLGNSKNYKEFSFLHKDKFKKAPTRLDREFVAEISWLDGRPAESRSLSEEPSYTDVESIKYLPQNYIEKICTELDAGQGSDFNIELQSALFTHLPEKDKLDKSSLGELIEHRSKEAKEAINHLKSRLTKTNQEIISLEEMLSADFKVKIEKQLSSKNLEIASHEASKPGSVEKPEAAGASDPETASLMKSLEENKEELGKLEAQKSQHLSRTKELSILINETNIVIDKLKNADSYIDDLFTDLEPHLARISIKQKEVVEYKSNFKPLEDNILKHQKELETINELFKISNKPGLAYKISKITDEITQTTQKLKLPEKRYHEFLEATKTWETKEKQLIGDKNIEGTRKYFEQIISEIDNAPNKLSDRKRQRNDLLKAIHDKLSELKSYYEEYFKPVQEFIGKHDITKTGALGLEMNVSIYDRGFTKQFLDMINQGRVGYFQGVVEGNKKVEDILDSADFDSYASIEKMLNTVLDNLENHNGIKLNIEDQLNSHVMKQDLYDFIYGLDYLEPRYEMRLDGKRIEKLSPGERGSILLIFYLLIDQDSKPLVIDQPEENLDNESVYKVLVPCIRDAKERRQVIMVTHNPNIAVVCDAEQIIHSDIDKASGNKVTYTTGAIENPEINKKLIDVLEGTRPAFDNRDHKYFQT